MNKSLGISKWQCLAEQKENNMRQYVQIKDRYGYHFIGECKVLLSIKEFLQDKVCCSSMSDELTIMDYEPLEAKIVDCMAQVVDFVMYVTYGTYDCGCWSYHKGKELSAALTNVRREMGQSMSYKEFVERENFFTDLTNKIINGMTYESFVEFVNLADCKGIKLIQKFENNSTVNALKQKEYFQADKNRLIERLKDGDIDADWTNYMTFYEYIVLALPEIQRRLKAGDDKAMHKIDEICEYLQVSGYEEYQKWLIERPNFSK